MEINDNPLTSNFTSRAISKGDSYYSRADIPMDQKHKRVVAQKDVNDLEFIDCTPKTIIIAVLVAILLMIKF